MNKKTRLVFIGIIVLVAILAGCTTFLVAQKYTGTSQSQATISPSTTGTNNTGNIVSSPTPSSEVTKAATSNEKPSKPTDIYTVQKGETMYSIAQAQGTNWQDLADANGITDVNKIQAGQNLIIPKSGQISFTIDNTRATSLQKDADQGKYQFRLSAEDTARSDAPNVYGLTVTDAFVMSNRDMEGAQVKATHEEKNYLIKLVQPITKGEKGIWAIESIKPM